MIRSPARRATPTELVIAGRRAWIELTRDQACGVIDLVRLDDPYLAGKLLERWLRARAANSG